MNVEKSRPSCSSMMGHRRAKRAADAFRVRASGAATIGMTGMISAIAMR